MYVSVYVWMDGCMHGWMDGWMDVYDTCANHTKENQKNKRLKWSVSLLNPLKKCSKSIAQRW